MAAARPRLTAPLRARSGGLRGTPPIQLTFQITGTERVLRNLTGALHRVRIATPLALAHATRIIRDAAAPLTPVDTGDTLYGLYRTVVRVTRDVYYGEVGYQTPYAPLIHENPFHFTFKRVGAEEKFLEKAVLRNINEINAALQTGLVRALYGII